MYNHEIAIIYLSREKEFLAPTGALEEVILYVRACMRVCVLPFLQKNIENEL